MTVYMKNFVLMSLVYLGLATIFGILNGVTEIGYFASFAHTHFNLLGFMSMIVFGIGYFILPRFNGTDLYFENWVTPHFYIGNISLIGMVLFRGLQINTGETMYEVLFIISASLQAISIFMFIINIFMTLVPGKKPQVEQKKATVSNQPQNTGSFVVKDVAAVQNISVTPETKVADLVDALPSLKQTLIDCGLLSLQMPGHIDKVRQMGITIGMAAANHSLDIDAMILKLENELNANGYSTNPNLDEYAATSNLDPQNLTTDILIGEIIETFPKSKVLFQQYFGDGCFECPGQSYESLDMACRMHSVDPEQFLSELKEVLA